MLERAQPSSELLTVACRHEEYLETNIPTKESKPQTEKT
jgi:hypothetical protein